MFKASDVKVIKGVAEKNSVENAEELKELKELED